MITSPAPIQWPNDGPPFPPCSDDVFPLPDEVTILPHARFEVVVGSFIQNTFVDGVHRIWINTVQAGDRAYPIGELTYPPMLDGHLVALVYLRYRWKAADKDRDCIAAFNLTTGEATSRFHRPYEATHGPSPSLYKLGVWTILGGMPAGPIIGAIFLNSGWSGFFLLEAIGLGLCLATWPKAKAATNHSWRVYDALKARLQSFRQQPSPATP